MIWGLQVHGYAMGMKWALCVWRSPFAHSKLFTQEFVRLVKLEISWLKFISFRRNAIDSLFFDFFTALRNKSQLVRTWALPTVLIPRDGGQGWYEDGEGEGASWKSLRTSKRKKKFQSVSITWMPFWILNYERISCRVSHSIFPFVWNWPSAHVLLGFIFFLNCLFF